MFDAAHRSTAPPYRASAATWMMPLATVFVLCSLVSLLLTPLWIHERTETLRRQIEETADPARALVDDIELALAREVSAIRGFLLTDEEPFRGFFYEAQAEADEAFESLYPLAGQLGADIHSHVAMLDSARQQWLYPYLDVLHERVAPEQFVEQIPTQQRRYVQTIEAAKQLNTALSDAVNQRRDRIRTIERMGAYLTALLSFLAACSVLIILWFSRRLHTLTKREQQARANAEAAIRTRDDVLAMVSHDLRSPLATISLSTSLLGRSLSDEEKHRHLALIQRTTERMNRLIQDILDATRVEAGQPLHIKPDYVDVHALMDEVRDMLQTHGHARVQQLRCLVPASLPPIYADHDRIVQVLTNLLSNAINFTPDGGQITLAVQETGSELLFSVTDTGPGISEADRERIFNPYWQVRRTARLGAGLGLTISKGIVDGHGGRIWVESVPGAGCTFFFTLPRTGSKIQNAPTRPRVHRPTPSSPAP